MAKEVATNPTISVNDKTAWIGGGALIGALMSRSKVIGALAGAGIGWALHSLTD